MIDFASATPPHCITYHLVYIASTFSLYTQLKICIETEEAASVFPILPPPPNGQGQNPSKLSLRAFQRPKFAGVCLDHQLSVTHVYTQIPRIRFDHVIFQALLNGPVSQFRVREACLWMPSFKRS